MRRDAMASRFRDWIHETPLSQCNMGSDTCPDWPLAYELADLALSIDAADDTPEQPSVAGELQLRGHGVDHHGVLPEGVLVDAGADPTPVGDYPGLLEDGPSNPENPELDGDE